MITVIDYKAGNLTSVLKTLRHLGAETVVTDGDLSLVESAERIVLPGVGHFAATERLDCDGTDGRDSRGDCARRAVSGHLRGDAVALLGIDGSAASSRGSGISRNRARGLPKARKKCRMWGGIRWKCGTARDCCRGRAG